MKKYSKTDIKNSLKPDTWWTVIITDPIAIRLLYLIINRTSISPNEISLIAISLVFISALLFSMGSYIWLLLGAFLWQISFILDCMDGKLARLKNKITKKGYLLETIHTQIECSICPLALAYGQFVRTEDFTYITLLLLALFIFNAYFLLSITTEKTEYYQPAVKKIIYKKEKLIYILAKKYLQLKEKFNQHRLIPLPTATEASAILCFIAPLLFQIKAGLICYIIICLFAFIYTLVFRYINKKYLK